MLSASKSHGMNHSITAQILIGAPARGLPGLMPTHALYLLEGVQLNWLLSPVNLFQGHSLYEQPVNWETSEKYLFDDAVLMLAVNVLKAADIVDLAKQYFRKTPFQNLILSRDIHWQDLEMLHQRCLDIQLDFKLAITIMPNSTLHNALPKMKSYPFDIDICR